MTRYPLGQAREPALDPPAPDPRAEAIQSRIESLTESERAKLALDFVDLGMHTVSAVHYEFDGDGKPVRRLLRVEADINLAFIEYLEEVIGSEMKWDT